MTYIPIDKRVYRLIEVPASKLPPGTFGECEYSGSENDFPVIRICEGLSGCQLVDTILHEVMHAITDEYLSESAVSKIATAQARALMRLGVISRDAKIRRKRKAEDHRPG